jgi:hypothetical protein
LRFLRFCCWFFGFLPVYINDTISAPEFSFWARFIIFHRRRGREFAYYSAAGEKNTFRTQISYFSGLSPNANTDTVGSMATMHVQNLDSKLGISSRSRFRTARANNMPE